jgi:hypothetical protein
VAIIASNSGGGTFTPHPEGQYPAVCADVQDLGLVQTTWQGQTKSKHMIYVYFYCGQRKEDGTPLLVRERFTLSLNENARLRPFLENWRGRKFTAEEEKGFDVEKLIGAPAFLQIAHNAANDGKVYANVQTIMRIPQGLEAPKLPADFVRPSQRPPREEASRPAAVGAPTARSSERESDGYDNYTAPPREDDGYRAPRFPEDDDLDPLPF